MRQAVTSHGVRRDALRASGSQRTANTSSTRSLAVCICSSQTPWRPARRAAGGGRVQQLRIFASSDLRATAVARVSDSWFSDSTAAAADFPRAVSNVVISVNDMAGVLSTNPARRQAAPLMRLSWHHYALIVAVGLALAAIFGIVLAPDLADRDARHAVKQFEREFGFETGIVTVTDPTGTYTTWGITGVTAGGSFDRLGFRAGDVPFDHHGHAATWLYGAVREASHGKSTEIEVYKPRDVAAGATARTRIVITAIR